MIPRTITPELRTLTGEYPVVTILGPRQAGKTTLARNALEGYDYCNLESPEEREFARTDPKAFMARFRSKTVFDEPRSSPPRLIRRGCSRA